MRRTLPVVLFIMLALLLASSFASGAVNAAANQPTDSAGASANRVAVTAERGEQIARDYLLANAATYGVSRADLTELRAAINTADSFTGARIVKFVQTVNGIEVYHGQINVAILPNGEVFYVGNAAVANLAQNAAPVAPALSQAEAIAAAASELGLTYTASSVSQTESVAGAEREIRYSGGDLSLEYIPVRLVYTPMADGSLRLTWDMNIYQLDAQHWWDIRVDANTGKIVSKSDWVVSENWDALLNDPGQVPTGAVPGKLETIIPFAQNIVAPYAPVAVGSYRVYGIPTESPSHSTPAAPADGRTLIANPDNATASPFGWHDTNGAAGAEFTTTQGNNAHAYTDTDANNTPDAGSSPDGGAGLVFDFPLDLTLAPSAYRPAAVTNLFYWNNLMHDISYLYGFTEANRNFQENNYGNGGVASDYVNAEAQDGSGTNNANFASGTDGTNGRMQMYLWTAPNPDRDGDLDNGIIAHEYGHGVSNRLTGTGAGCLSNAEQMGEGWSDWQSVILTMRTGDTATTNRGVGTYALNQPTTGIGIRPAPYNTNFAVNNYTYSNLPSMAIPHGVGFVWNTMLWEMNWELINFHGFNPNIYDFTAINDGNTLAHRLVMLGLDLQPCSPGFVQGRDAILAADVAVTGGANECRIWAAFARRGLGSSASQGSSSSTSDGTAAFDLPAQCTGGPTPTPSNTPVPTITQTPGTGNRICSSTVVTIPDSNPTGVTSVINVGTAGTLSDINVVISSTHTWVGDLAFNLSNGSTNVTFYDRPGVPASTFGCTGDNILGSIADDEGTNGSWENSCTASTPAFTPGGTYTNNTALTAFDGAAAAGNWTLTVSDNAGGDTGTLDGWCVDLTVGGGGPTPTATATSQPTAPDINVNPGSFTETHGSAPQVTTDTMNIQNVGSGSLTWTITEDDTATDWVPAPLVPSANSVERVSDGAAPAPATNPAPVGKPAYVPGMNGTVLYDNGPLVNAPGGGAGGADASRLQDSSLLLSTYGFGHAISTGFRVADDFTVPAGETWTVNTVTFYSYQTGSTTTSTINNVNVRIWDGPPGVGSVVYGDTTTNRLASSSWSNIYRDLESAPGDSSRPIMASTVTISTTLAAGTYWIDWQTGGTLGSGPWAPPITINGTAVTGNGVQFDPAGSVWNAAIDAGAAAQQGFPFVVEGTGGGGGGACTAPTDIPWLTVSPTNGSTAGGGSTPVTLTYNSASLAAGTYTGTLCIASNDPDEALVTVPITLNVGPPTAIDLSSFTSPVAGVNLGDLAAAGLLLLAGAVLILRRK